MVEQVPVEPLTPREREILALLAQGRSNDEIVERMFLSINTVKWYNRQIFAKLGVDNRKQARRRASELGLLGGPDETVSMPENNLPAALTPFIGRSVELAEVRQLLAHPHTRLVTILAPGGMGKTRLALEAVGALLDQYADGVYFAPLAGITSHDYVVPAIADALGAQFVSDGRTPERQLADFLRRKHLLLILDNFEHLLDAAPLVSELLAAAPNIRILATSREKLGVTGEIVYTVAGIDYPDAATPDPERYGAVQLFVECALRANPNFQTDDSGSIARVCRMVQGMPLAIELAAAWAGTLTADEIAHEVEQSADFLTTKSTRDVPERLRSVRAVFEAAWARLDEDARRAFRRMSVFRGGCTREAAQAVTGASLPTLAVLVDKALLWRNPRSRRYEIHELLRQYADGELEKAGEAEVARQAHQDYYAALTAAWTAAMMHDKVEEGLAVFDADIKNVRAAFAQASEHAIPAEIEPFTDLFFYYLLHGNIREGLMGFEAACDRLEQQESVALGKLLAGRAMLYNVTFFFSQGLEVGQRAVALLRRLNEQRHLPFPLIIYADSLRNLSQWPEAKVLYQEALRIAEHVGMPLMAMNASRKLALAPRAVRNNEDSKALVLDARRQAKALNNVWALYFTNMSLGKITYAMDELDEAAHYFSDALASARKIQSRIGIDEALEALGDIARDRHEWELSRRYAFESLQIRVETGHADHRIFEGHAHIAYMSVTLGDTKEARSHLFASIPYLNEEAIESCFKLWLQTAAGYFLHIGEIVRAAEFLSYFDVMPEVDPHYSANYFYPIYFETAADCLEQCRAALSPEEFAAAVERGKTLTPEAAIAELSAFL